MVLTFEDRSWGLYVGPQHSPGWFSIGFYRFWPISFEWELGRKDRFAKPS
jgi:hypothetical protein